MIIEFYRNISVILNVLHAFYFGNFRGNLMFLIIKQNEDKETLEKINQIKIGIFGCSAAFSHAYGVHKSFNLISLSVCGWSWRSK